MKDEEMAEEYLKEKLEERKDKFVFELPEVYITDIPQAFLAGLKAGRPQWHYVKDELPKESKKYYVYSEEWGVEVRKFIADAGCFECRNNIIIAWKEIVLPKEIE